MLFSEPKIPQSRPNRAVPLARLRFSALQRAENSSIGAAGDAHRAGATFQCSSASRKFLNRVWRWRCSLTYWVSVLFSEPKIPQWMDSRRGFADTQQFQCSSASRKFLNSPLPRLRASPAAVSVLFSEPKIPQWNCASRSTAPARVSVLFSEPKIPQSARRVRAVGLWCRFQCSSASRKFLNHRSAPVVRRSDNGFSALQRAENSSMLNEIRPVRRFTPFQCSSASRKFLNRSKRRGAVCVDGEFQCSSASRKFLNTAGGVILIEDPIVSVLFSEPKIPQSAASRAARVAARPFQCSSASRKFLNRAGGCPGAARDEFQCSSASRKFLNVDGLLLHLLRPRKFQCSSASRKFLNNLANAATIVAKQLFQCSSASRKFLNEGGLHDETRSPPRSFSALQRAENSSIATQQRAVPYPNTFQCSSASRKFLNAAFK